LEKRRIESFEKKCFFFGQVNFVSQTPFLPNGIRSVSYPIKPFAAVINAVAWQVRGFSAARH
jgi:hypothetical protein